jgi:hypothetical protein
MLERDIEKDNCEYARKRYMAMALKFSSPQRRNVPDRMFVFSGGIIGFIEYKAPGGVPTSGQEREMQRLRDRGCRVEWTDNILKGRGIIDRWAAYGRIITERVNL